MTFDCQTSAKNHCSSLRCSAVVILLSMPAYSSLIFPKTLGLQLSYVSSGGQYTHLVPENVHASSTKSISLWKITHFVSVHSLIKLPLKIVKVDANNHVIISIVWQHSASNMDISNSHCCCSDLMVTVHRMRPYDTRMMTRGTMKTLSTLKTL